MGRPKKTATPTGPAVKKAVGLENSIDIITENDLLWRVSLRRLNRLSKIFGFKLVETPLLEDARLYENFYRDQKEKLSQLVTVELGNKQAVMRPQLLPSVLRLYYNHKIFEKSPMSKWFYLGQTVRKDLSGKSVESDLNFGFEVFGNFNHLTEAQVVAVVWEFLVSLGLEEISLEINNIGNPECQRVYTENLQDYIATKKYDLCDLCNDHAKSRALNVFRCPNLDCQATLAEAPTILDFLDQESHKHFTNILEALDELGIPYQLNPQHVGPPGHSKTNFLIKYKNKGKTVVLGEGGYHESLMQSLCNKNFCCFGFSGSLLRVYEALSAQKITVDSQSQTEVFLVPLGELAAKKSLRLFRDLVAKKVSVHDHFGEGGVKNQLRQAESFKAPVALIMGQKEAMDEMVILRDVKSGMQEVISYDKIVEEVKKRLGR